VKIKKSQLKELVRQSIFELSEADGQQPPAKKDSEETEKKLKINIPSNPFDGDKEHAKKAKLSKIKEILRKKIKEIKFKDKAAFDKYSKKHKMRKSTKVDIGGKETTAGDAAKSGKPKGDDMTTGGPAYANVPKGAKSSGEARKMKQIDDLNKKAEKGQGAQIDTEHGTVTWDSGDPNEDSFMAIDQDGGEVELSYDDIVRFHDGDEPGFKFFCTCSSPS
jgi:hypothetical protein